MKFMVEIRDYEAGSKDRDITASRIESAIQRMLDRDASDGVVIVKKATADADQG